MYRLKKRLKNEKGQGLVEYGLILALVSVVAILVLSMLGVNVRGQLEEIVGLTGGSEQIPNLPALPEYDISQHLASDSDFEWVDDHYKYIGSATEVTVPHTIQSRSVTSYNLMFEKTAVEIVHSDNPNVTDMTAMFAASTAPKIELKYFDTSNVSNMTAMFSGSAAQTIDVRYFDTSKVSAMYSMFAAPNVKTLDLSHFDYSAMWNTQGAGMGGMFSSTNLEVLDMSSFDLKDYGDVHNRDKHAFTAGVYGGATPTTLYVKNDITAEVIRHDYSISSGGLNDILVK